jgi:hypothetical protein
LYYVQKATLISTEKGFSPPPLSQSIVTDHSTAMSLDIDYSPTDHLYRRPIIFCEKPKIIYAFSQLSAYWNADDLKHFLEFVFGELKPQVYCWFYKHPDNIRYFEKVTYEKAVEIITVNHKYLSFFFSMHELDFGKMIAGAEERGTFFCHTHARIWLSFFHTVLRAHLDKGKVVDKSHAFRTLTARMEQWLATHFVTKRGKYCYDGEQAYEKFMTKKRSVQ